MRSLVSSTGPIIRVKLFAELEPEPDDELTDEIPAPALQWLNCSGKLDNSESAKCEELRR